MDFPTALDTARALVAALEAHAGDPNESSHAAVIAIGEVIEGDIFGNKPWH